MKSKMNYYNQQSDRLIFRKLKASDLQAWSEFFVDNPNIPYLGLPAYLSQAELSHLWFDMQFERYEANAYGHLAAISKQTGKMIGQCGILIRELNGQREYEIAYSLIPKYWRQGYATEMATTMKQFAFESQVNNRVISIIHKDNAGSIKVAQNNGMEVLFEMEYKGMECFIYGCSI